MPDFGTVLFKIFYYYFAPGIGVGVVYFFGIGVVQNGIINTWYFLQGLGMIIFGSLLGAGIYRHNDLPFDSKTSYENFIIGFILLSIGYIWGITEGRKKGLKDKHD